MTTHCDTTIWLEGEPTITIKVTDGTAWAWIGDCITIHTIEGKTGAEDLEVLERFFRRGLDAILEVRNPRLFEKLADAGVVSR